MLKKIISNTILVFTIITSPTIMAHTGFHNDTLTTNIHHTLSGIDHFSVILLITLLSGIVSYYLFKK
jgi:hydrogenase/urease accessory protein HupE